MKARAIISLLSLLCIAGVAVSGVDLTPIPRPQQALGGDSLGTAAETTYVPGTTVGYGRNIPNNLRGFACVADDSVTILWQFSADNGTTWINFATLDTIAAEVPDTCASATGLKEWPGARYRAVINDLEGGAVKYFYLYERR